MHDNLPEHIEPSSPNFQTELAQKIAEIVPEAVSDGKLDIAKIRELVNGDAETAQEKFGLFWPGKRASQAVAQTSTTATLVPAPDESEDWDTTRNIFIEGDNLEVLKALQNSYRRKIKMIYIDPPYNTGKEFIYPDKFTEGLQGYLEYTGQKNESGESVESKPETGGRKHSNWLSMMYPRLQLAKSLLTDDGIILSSIDDNEQANLKKLLDEVFGEENFIGIFKWNKTSKAPTLSKLIRNKYEYVIAYRRSSLDLLRGQASYNTMAPLLNGGNNYSEVTFAPGMIKLSFADGTYQKGTFGKAANQVELLDDLIVENSYNKLPIRIKARFKWTQRTVNDRYAEGQSFAFKKPNFTTMYYTLDNQDGSKFIAPSDIINNEETGVLRNDDAYNELTDLMGEVNVFDYTKPVSLIKYLINMHPTDDFIVLDFFSGSATTAHAVMELNAQDGGRRTHIQVQLPEPVASDTAAYKSGYRTIADIAKERIRRAGKKIRADYADAIAERMTPLDTGFRVYKLAASNFVQWDEQKAKADIEQAVLDFAVNKKPNATSEALLSEILLQARLPLSAHIERRELQKGSWVYVVDNGSLIAYVADEAINEAQAEEIAQLKPIQFIVLDSAFNGDNALKINVANICKEHAIKEFKTI